MIIKRMAESTVRQRLRESPAVTIIGPRQCGKTTLARFIGGRYYDLEQDGDWLRLDLEWDQIVAGTELVILDEAQTRPDLFPRLRGAIDAAPERHGRFLLLGSVSPALMTRVSESLAGRLALVELMPLTLPEIGAASLDRLWLLGGFPAGGILADGAKPAAWAHDYLVMLAQRDLPVWGLPARPPLTERLLAMTAALHGQQWNASQVGQSLGLSHTTVGHYMDYLEGAFLVRALRPWQGNVRKRLVRRPKYYWRDSGLLHALMGVKSFAQLLRQPWCGAGWEGFAIEQILAVAACQYAPPIRPWFFRTSDGYEMDMLLELDGKRLGFEFKLSSRVNREDGERVRKAAAMTGVDKVFLISRSAMEHRADDLWIVPLPGFLAALQEGTI